MAEFNSFNDSTPAQADSSGFRLATKTSTGKYVIDYKLADDLRRFLTPNGKVQGRKKTGFSAREQRMAAQAIKRARYMGLLPYTSATL